MKFKLILELGGDKMKNFNIQIDIQDLGDLDNDVQLLTVRILMFH